MIGRASRMLEVLRDWPRHRVRIDELWRVFDAVDPATRTSVQRRQLLADTLAELATAGHLLLPSQRSYDRTEHPALPTFVNLPRPQAAVTFSHAGGLAPRAGMGRFGDTGPGPARRADEDQQLAVRR